MKHFITFLLCAAALAAAPPAGKMDSAEIARITPRLQSFVDRGSVAGIVALAARHGEIAYFDAVGFQDLEAKKPMRKDAIFQIMSMTKPVTAVGIMLLAEEGKLTVSDSVERYLPEFRGQLMVQAKSADGQSQTVRKPSRPITIRDLLTHTSGLPGAPAAGLSDLYQKMDHSLAEAVALSSQALLDFEPGSKWAYSNMGIATLGRIIEVCSGEPYEKFLADRIFTPLGMKDSFFFPPADKTGRIAMVYNRKDGKLARAGADILGGDPAAYRKGARYPAPEFGLFSTAQDLFALYSMMLNGGVGPGGKRLLSKSSVDVMTALHTGDIEPAGHSSGMGYGLAWTVVRDAMGTLKLQSVGTYGHGGAFGTQGWIDPKSGVVGVFMIQRSGGTIPAPDESDAFKTMIGAAVVD